MRRTLVIALALVAAGAGTSEAATQQKAKLRQAPGVAPVGANDFSCRSPARPAPVILVHGTFADMTMSWNALAPALKADGYCVFALDLVRRGMAPIDESADRLAAFVREVLSRTGAARVSFVGHSQGGLLARYVVKSRGLLSQADDVIGLAPSSHGTDTPAAGWAARWFDCPACAEQQAGSAFLATANAAPEAPEPASYTVLSTRYDQVVTPVASQALSGATVTNVVLQDACPNDVTDHVGMPYDPIALQWILNALGRSGPADPAFRPDCTGIKAVGGTARNGAGGMAGPHDEPVRKVEVARKPVRLHDGERVGVHVKCVGDADCEGVLVLRRDGKPAGSTRFTVPKGTKQLVSVILRARAVRSLRASGRPSLTGSAFVARAGGVAERVDTRFEVRV